MPITNHDFPTKDRQGRTLGIRFITYDEANPKTGKTTPGTYWYASYLTTAGEPRTRRHESKPYPTPHDRDRAMNNAIHQAKGRAANPDY